MIEGRALRSSLVSSPVSQAIFVTHVFLPLVLLSLLLSFIPPQQFSPHFRLLSVSLPSCIYIFIFVTLLIR
jgi:hypothetical protein